MQCFADPTVDCAAVSKVGSTVWIEDGAAVSSGDGEGMLEQPTAARPMRKTARTVTGGNHCLGMEVPTLRDVGGLTASS